MQKFSKNFSKSVGTPFDQKPSIYWSLFLKAWVYTGTDHIDSLTAAVSRMNKVAK